MGLDGMLPGVLRKIMTGRSASGLEEGKCHPCVQERQEGEIRDLQASQPCFNPQKMMELLILQNIFQACFTKARKSSRVACMDSPKKCHAGPVIKQKWLTWRAGGEQWILSAWTYTSPIKILIDRLLIQGLDERQWGELIITWTAKTRGWCSVAQGQFWGHCCVLKYLHKWMFHCTAGGILRFKYLRTVSY